MKQIAFTAFAKSNYIYINLICFYILMSLLDVTLIVLIASLENRLDL